MTPVLSSSARDTDKRLPPLQGAHWPPPDPTMRASPRPAVRSGQWGGGHPGRSSSWALGGGAQGQRGWWERQQGEGSRWEGEETEGRWLRGPSAPPGLAEAGDGSAPSPSTLSPDYLAGLFSGWKSLAKALDTNGNSSGSQGQAQETKGLAGRALTAPLHGVPCQGPQSHSPWRWGAEPWSILYRTDTATSPFPFGCWEAQELQQVCIPVHGFVQTSFLILCHALPLSSSLALCFVPL